jgi:aquaporin Z
MEMVGQRPAQSAARTPAGIWQALSSHWPEYLMETAELGMFMVAACVFTVALESPSSAIRQAIGDPLLRRGLMGLAMGGTAIALIYSPWGKQSGAHFNPGVTLSFLYLGRIQPWDAVLYVGSQFIGGVGGVLLAAAVLGSALAHPAVNYAATIPGSGGVGWAFLAEVAISFVLMTVVLTSSNNVRLASFTGMFAGLLVAAYITVEAPLSGMSMNPARSLASAVPGRLWTGLWLYFTAPPLGMLAAAAIFRRLRGAQAVLCAKLHHLNDKRCIFCCGFAELPKASFRASASN